MQSRYNQIIDETSSTGAALSEWYKRHEIEIYDQQGQLLSLYDVLGKVAKIWPTLSKNEQTYYLNQQAGANQTQNLAAILSNFDTAIEATATALESAGSAARENSRYMESLEAKVAQLQSTFQQLSSTVVDSELVSTLLDLANNVLTKLNSEAGATVIQWGLLTGVLTGGIVIFGTIASKLIGMIGTIVQVVAGVTTLTASFGTLASVAFPIAGLIAGIAVAGYSLYKYYKQANPTLEEATENLTNLQNELKTNQERLDEINSIPWYDRTDDIYAEREELMKLNEELEKQIRLAEEQQIEAARKVTTKDRTTPTGSRYETRLNGEVHNIIQDAGYSQKVYVQMLAQAVGVQDEFMGSTELMKEGLKQLGFTIRQVSQDIEVGAEESNKYYIDSLNNMTSAIKAAQDADLGGAYIDQRIRNYNKEIESLSEVVEAYKLLRDNGEELSDSALELIDAYDEWISTSGQVRDEMAEQDRVANVVANGLKVEAASLAQLIAKYPELASATATANGNSYILADTLLDLAASGDEVALAMANASRETLRLATVAASQDYKSAVKNFIQNTSSATADAMSAAKDNLNQAIAAEQALIAAINEGNKLTVNVSTSIDTGGSGGGGSGSVAGVLDGIKDYLEKEEHKVFLLDKNDQEGNAQAIIDIYKNAQNVIHAYADKLRGLGYAEDSAEIRELQELWWEYQDNIEQVYENIRQIAEEKAAEAEKAWSEALQDNIESLQEQQSAYESLFNHMVSNIEKEIAALEEQKNAEEQYWDDKINALEEQNDELDRQLDLEKKMDALAKARQKKVMVYKDGRFQYIEDIDEVSVAQEELDEYNREEALRQEIENLEKLKEEAISNIDDQIEAWEEYKEAWSSIVDDYQKEQDRLLIEQQLGIDIENDNWKERLDNFKSFADEYINAMKELQAAQNEYNQGYQGPTADDYYDDIISSMQPTDNWEYLDSIIRGQSATLPNGRIVRVSIVNGHTQTKGLPVGSVVHTNGGDWQVTAVNSDGSYQSQKVNGYASGTLSASGGMSLVGENGPELRVVNSGDGIIPAEITKNLWAWGNFSPGNLIGGLINTLSTMKENSGIIIQNFNPNLSNVTDGESFVAYLQNNFVGDVMQIVHA